MAEQKYTVWQRLGRVFGPNSTLDQQSPVFKFDKKELLKTADIVVLSTHYEGLSLASIEGLASGKPFVASDVPGLSEIVTGAGVLFQSQNEKALAVEINRLIDDNDYKDKIVKQCVNRAKEYDIEIMVEKHLNLYRSF